MKNELKPKCCAQVYDSSTWRHYPCGKNAKYERYTGMFCGIHDPIAVKLKERARADKYNAKCALRRAAIAANINAQTELERRAGCFDELLEALIEVMDRLVDKHDEDVAAIMARAAIAKATGETL